MVFWKSARFDKWFDRRVSEYDFTINSDFCPILTESSGGRPSTEYHLTIDMAKELSMVERNAKGKQARQYFIACEKKLREIQEPEQKAKAIKAPTRARVVSDFAANVRLAKIIGLEGNQALLSANRMTANQYQEFGVDPLKEAGVELISENQVQYLTVTAIGKQYAHQISAVKVNKTLEEAGLQKVTRDHKNRLVWVPTEKGKEFCQLLDTGKKYGSGAPILQIKWQANILEELDQTQVA